MYIKNRRNSSKFRASGSYQTLCLTESLVLRMVFIRAPIDGYYVDTEYQLYPRDAYWERLIEECDCLGYHYADYPESKNMIPPEWSHLNRKDSDRFTRLLIELLQKDQLL